MKNKLFATIAYPIVLSVVFVIFAAPSFGGTIPFESPDETREKTAAAMTLDLCIETALKNNPDLQASRDEKQIAASDRQIVEAERWPHFKLKGGITEFDDDQRLVPARFNGEQGVFSRNISDIAVTVRMPLFSGGRIIHSVRAAELNETASIERFKRSTQELTFNVISAFYTILGQTHQLKSIDFSKDVLQKDRSRMEALINAKKAAAVDLLRMNVRLAQVEQQRVQVRNEIYVAYRILYNLMGLETSFGNNIPSIDGSLTPLPIVPDIENAFQVALSQRPDFLELKSRAEAQMEQVDGAKGRRWPEIYIEGAYGYRHAGDITDNPSGADSSEDMGSIGLKLEMPLFEGGRIQAGIRKELQKSSVLRQKLTALRLRIQKEVETSVFNMESSRRRVETQEAAIAQAHEVLRIEQEKYRLGKGTILDVLDSQRALLDIETAYYQALADYHIATHRFLLARGDKL